MKNKHQVVFEIVTQHELQMWVTEPQALACAKKARNDNMKERIGWALLQFLKTQTKFLENNKSFANIWNVILRFGLEKHQNFVKHTN